MNLRASYQWRQARIDFGVENLFDKRYDLPLGGAYVGQGSTMALNAANMPRGIRRSRRWTLPVCRPQFQILGRLLHATLD
ncbi:hypothetical protein [Propionivibrio sp.]|uniref:hypothetical protein n=1 Tax=Propionivibrio sp. TaxID=2212460 RepID=UPI0025D19114|nr:hypothetical protein [Propionivibrio sp.]MBK7356184.1 hypothetical protein [Propionivibrio sp.]